MTSDKRIILHADDDPMIEELVKRISDKKLTEFELEQFREGNSLENRLRNNLERVSLVITDNQMKPGISGSELIRRYAPTVQVPFILFYGGCEDIGEKALEDGAFGYIIKPYMMELVEMAKSALYSSTKLSQ